MNNLTALAIRIAELRRGHSGEHIVGRTDFDLDPVINLLTTVSERNRSSVGVEAVVARGI